MRSPDPSIDLSAGRAVRPAVLLDVGPTAWPQALADLAGLAVGQLLTPLTGYRLADPARPWAIDNGGFGGQDPAGLARLLARESAGRAACLWVAMPDVVCNGRRTLELFRHLAELGYADGWRRSLVLQNGVEDLDLPWAIIDAVFVGGDDRFKESSAAADCLRAARWLGKATHVGRVNTAARVRAVCRHWPLADTIGWSDHGADTIDGSGISRYSHMRRDVRDAILRPSEQPGLFTAKGAA